MKKLIQILCLIVLCLPVSFGKQAHAESQETIIQLEKQIDEIVHELNANRYALVETGQAIEQIEKAMQRNELEHKNLSAVIDSRIEQAKKRLLDLQINNEQYGVLNLLFSSENIVNFFERLFLVVQLQEAANEKITVAKASQERLIQLQNEHQSQLNELKQKQQVLQNQTDAVHRERIALEKLLAENKEAVEQIIAKKEKELAQAQAAEHANAQHDASIEKKETTFTPQNRVESSSTQPNTQQASQAIQQTTAAQSPGVTVQNSAVVQPTTSDSVMTPVLVTLADFKVKGVVFHGAIKFTYYSELVLPGGNLKIPGRHVNANGYVVDGDGYIVLANDAPIGTVIDTPFGAKGKVYDRGTFGNQYDVYIR
ncbi:hypothetical protein J7S27_04900 [Carnobacteriaceae bacterium zg-C25]|nr:hypothetical protein J7S27_04900 [Carnobacteriaceae bacterium zg-C25]